MAESAGRRLLTQSYYPNCQVVSALSLHDYSLGMSKDRKLHGGALALEGGYGWEADEKRLDRSLPRNSESL